MKGLQDRGRGTPDMLETAPCYNTAQTETCWGPEASGLGFQEPGLILLDTHPMWCWTLGPRGLGQQEAEGLGEGQERGSGAVRRMTGGKEPLAGLPTA